MGNSIVLVWEIEGFKGDSLGFFRKGKLGVITCMLGSIGGAFSSEKDWDFEVNNGEDFIFDCFFEEDEDRDLLMRFLTEYIAILGFFIKILCERD